MRGRRERRTLADCPPLLQHTYQRLKCHVAADHYYGIILLKRATLSRKTNTGFTFLPLPHLSPPIASSARRPARPAMHLAVNLPQ